MHAAPARPPGGIATHPIYISHIENVEQPRGPRDPRDRSDRRHARCNAGTAAAIGRGRKEPRHVHDRSRVPARRHLVRRASSPSSPARTSSSPSATSVVGRQLETRRRATTSSSTGESVVAWTAVAGVPAGFIEHVWSRDGVEVARQCLPVGSGRRWRTWSRHTVEAGQLRGAGHRPRRHRAGQDPLRGGRAGSRTADGASIDRNCPQPLDEEGETAMNRIRQILVRFVVFVRAGSAAVALGLIETFGSARGRRRAGPAGAGGRRWRCWCWRPPVRAVQPGMVGVRINRLTGGLAVLPDGPALVLPLIHELRRYPLRDQVYRPAEERPRRRRGPLPVDRGPVAGGGRHRALRARPRRVWRRWPGGCPRTSAAISSSRWSTACCTGRWPATPCARSSPTSGWPIQDEIQRELRALLARDGVVPARLLPGPRRPAREVPGRARGAAGRGAGHRRR